MLVIYGGSSAGALFLLLLKTMAREATINFILKVNECRDKGRRTRGG